MSPHNSAEIGTLAVRVKVFERAGEATATLGWNTGNPVAGGRGEAEGCSAGAPDAPGIHPEDGSDDARDLRTDHDRRAATRLRRYAAENGCSRLVTLTYAEQTDDLATVMADTARFLRRLRERHPAIAYVRVFERHASGNLHVHVALSGYVLKPELAALWGQGFVDVRLVRGRNGTRPGREAARKAARYISKYVVKDPVRAPGGHRYEVRQGCQPGERIVWVDGLDVAGALELIEASLGVEPTYRWTSAGSPDWLAPPLSFSSW